MHLTGVDGPRRVWGYGAARVGPPLLTVPLVVLREHLNLASDMGVHLVLVVAVAIIGGLGPALLTASIGAVLLNYFLTPPLHTLAVASSDNVIALICFVLVAVMVSWLVGVAERRSAAAAAAAEYEAVDRVRTALLRAVGHDLRTPLASAKVAVSGLRSPGTTLPEGERDELLESADDALDRLSGLVENLLDLSRLQAGALPVHLRAVAVDDVIAGALDSLGVASLAVRLDVADDLPPVHTDAGLLERVIANLVANAQRHAPAEEPPVLTARLAGQKVVLQVVDRGPGVPEAEREQAFQPFQRYDDSPAAGSSAGLGLGLALVRGLCDAMEIPVTMGQTPGGGLTMRLRIPVAVEQGRAR